mmetsp:Transcript_97658/g.188346  ORF Transcript_97658/g.188346 Transcript_97658/m.188346 type:complete len:526 (+) Transcript_97658:68-1645(+)
MQLHGPPLMNNAAFLLIAAVHPVLTTAEGRHLRATGPGPSLVAEGQQRLLDRRELQHEVQREAQQDPLAHVSRAAHYFMSKPGQDCPGSAEMVDTPEECRSAMAVLGGLDGFEALGDGGSVEFPHGCLRLASKPLGTVLFNRAKFGRQNLRTRAYCKVNLTDAAAEAPAQVAAPTIQEAMNWLKRSQDLVRKLERTLAATRTRLATVENKTVSASQGAPAARLDLLHLEAQAEKNKLLLDNVSMKVGDLLSTSRTDYATFQTSMDETEDVKNASALIAFQAERLVGDGHVKNRHGICLNAEERDLEGGKVNMWECKPGQVGEQWTYTPSTKQLKVRKGFCLDAPTAMGNGVVMWTCHENREAQQWVYNSSTGLLRNKNNVCLTAPQPGTKGSKLETAPCDEAVQSQQWNLVPGCTFMKQQLEELTPKIWAGAEAEGPHSIAASLARVKSTAANQKEFEGELRKKVIEFLNARLRRGVSSMRRALRHAAQYSAPIADFDNDGPTAGGPRSGGLLPPLGDDIGLDGQ